MKWPSQYKENKKKKYIYNEINWTHLGAWWSWYCLLDLIEEMSVNDVSIFFFLSYLFRVSMFNWHSWALSLEHLFFGGIFELVRWFGGCDWLHTSSQQLFFFVKSSWIKVAYFWWWAMLVLVTYLFMSILQCKSIYLIWLSFISFQSMLSKYVLFH